MPSPRTPLERAQDEIAETMCPWPDDFLDGLSPQANLLYARQVSMACLRAVAGSAAALQTSEGEEEPVVSEALNGCSAAVAGLTHAMVVLGLLPEEAEAALEAGMPAHD